MPATESQSVTDLIAALDGHAPDRVTPLLVLADAMADAEDPREAGVRALVGVGYFPRYYDGVSKTWTWWVHVQIKDEEHGPAYHDVATWWRSWWDELSSGNRYGENGKDYQAYSEAVLDAVTAFTRLTPDQQRAIFDASDPA